MNKMVAIDTTKAFPTDGTSDGPVDPVYAMIERHRLAQLAFDKAVNHPGVGNKSHPETAEAERINDRARAEAGRCAKQLFCCRPSTSAGVVALLRYISTLKVWEMPSYFNEEREVASLKRLCKSMAGALDAALAQRAPSSFTEFPSLVAGPDAELLGWIDQLWALVPRYWQIHAEYDAEEARWFKRRPSDDAEPDAAITAAAIPYDRFQEEMNELERKVFSTRARTLAGVKAKARWHLQFQCGGDIKQLDGSHCHVESLFLELGGQEIDPGLADRGLESRPKGAVDPIFAAIEAHQQTYAQYVSSLGEESDEDVNGDLETTDQTALALLTVEPTTIAGAAAFLAYYAEQTIQDVTYFPDADSDGDIPFAAALARLVSKSLRKLAPALSGRAAINEIGSGGCEEVMALKPPARDPIFAAIEENRRTLKAFGEAVDLECALEASLPSDRRCSFIKAGDENIVESDDPAWLGALRARHEASNAMEASAIELLNTEPTTVAGIESLLRHFVDQEEALFPDEVSDDDGSVEAFGASLVRHVADSLRKIAGATEAA
jgi:hypothetical protein